MNKQIKLPAECLTRIFRYLPPEDLNNCKEVCKRWRNLIKGIAMGFRRSHENDQSKEVKARNVAKLMNKNMHKVDLRFMGPRTWHVWSEDCPNITEMKVNVADLTHKGALDICTKYGKSLKHLVLWNGTLRFFEDEQPLMKDWEMFFDALKNLESVEFAYVEQISNEILYLLPRTIKKLIFKYTSIPDLEESDVFTRFRKLQRLEMICTYGLNEAILASFDEEINTTLQTLIMPGDQFVKRSEYCAYSCMRPIKQFPNLRHLNISNSLNLVDDQLLQLLSNECSQLEYVDLSRCKRVTELGLLALLKLKNFQVLLLNYLPNLINKNVALQMKNLKELHVRSMFSSLKVRGPEEESMTTFVKVAHKLQFLDLFDCDRVVEKVVSTANDQLLKRQDDVQLTINVCHTEFVLDKDTHYSPCLNIIRQWNEFSDY